MTFATNNDAISEGYRYAAALIARRLDGIDFSDADLAETASAGATAEIEEQWRTYIATGIPPAAVQTWLDTVSGRVTQELKARRRLVPTP